MVCHFLSIGPFVTIDTLHSADHLSFHYSRVWMKNADFVHVMLQYFFCHSDWLVVSSSVTLYSILYSNIVWYAIWHIVTSC